MKHTNKKAVSFCAFLQFLSFLIFFYVSSLGCTTAAPALPVTVPALETLIAASAAILENFCSHKNIEHTHNFSDTCQEIKPENIDASQVTPENIFYLTAAHNDIPHDIAQKAYSEVVAHEAATHTQTHVLQNTLPFPKTIAHVQWPTYTIDSPISITHTPTTSTVQYKNFHATLGLAQPQELSWVRSQIVNQSRIRMIEHLNRRATQEYTARLRHDPVFREHIEEQLIRANTILCHAAYDRSWSNLILARLLMNKLELYFYHGDALRTALSNFNQHCFDRNGVVKWEKGQPELLCALALFGTKIMSDWYETLTHLPIPNIKQACDRVYHNNFDAYKNIRTNTCNITNNSTNDKIYEFIMLCTQGSFDEASKLKSSIPKQIASYIWHENLAAYRNHYFNEFGILRAHEADPAWSNLNLASKRAITASDEGAKFFNTYLANRHEYIQSFCNHWEIFTPHAQAFLYTIADLSPFKQSQEIVKQVMCDTTMQAQFCWPNGALKTFTHKQIAQNLDIPDWIRKNPEYHTLINQLLVVHYHAQSKELADFAYTTINHVLELSGPLEHGQPTIVHVLQSRTITDCEDQELVSLFSVPFVFINPDNLQPDMQNNGLFNGDQDDEEDTPILSRELRQRIPELRKRKLELQERFGISPLAPQGVQDLLYILADGSDEQFIKKLHDLEKRAYVNPAVRESLELLKEYLPEHVRILAENYEHVIDTTNQLDTKIETAKSQDVKIHLQEQRDALDRSIHYPFDTHEATVQLNQQAQQIIEVYGQEQAIANDSSHCQIQAHIQDQLTTSLNTIATDPRVQERDLPEKFYTSTLDMMRIAHQALNNGEYDKACTIAHFMSTISEFSEYIHHDDSKTLDHLRDLVYNGTGAINALPEQYQDILQAGAYAMLADFDDATISSILSNVATTQSGDFTYTFRAKSITENVTNILGYEAFLALNLYALQFELDALCKTKSPFMLGPILVTSCAAIRDVYGICSELNAISDKHFIVYSDGTVTKGTHLPEMSELVDNVTGTIVLAGTVVQAANIVKSGYQFTKNAIKNSKALRTLKKSAQITKSPSESPIDLVFDKKSNSYVVASNKKSTQIVKSASSTTNSLSKIRKNKIKAANQKIVQSRRQTARTRQTYNPTKQDKIKQVVRSGNALERRIDEKNIHHPKCSAQLGHCLQDTCLKSLPLKDPKKSVAKMRGKQKGKWDKTKPNRQKPMSIDKVKEELGEQLNKTYPGYGPLKGKKVNLDTTDHTMQPDIKGKNKNIPGGLHYDPSKKVESGRRYNGQKIKIISKRAGGNGVYEITWSIENGINNRFKKSGMWPTNMTYEEVNQKSYEIWQYCASKKIKPKLDPKTLNLCFEGFTAEGIRAVLVTDLDGQAITSYPIVD